MGTQVMNSTRNWYLVSSLSIVFATAVDLMGISPWPLVFGLFALCTIWFAQKTDYVLAIALSTFTLLAGVAGWYQLASLMPGELSVKTVGVEVIVSLTLLLLIGKISPISFPSRSSLAYYFPAAVLPVLSVTVIWLFGLIGKLGYSWAMHNDAVWNIVVSRFVSEDGGVVASVHSNPSPLIPELLSFSSLSGRYSQSTQTLFQHDMTRAAETWLLIALLSSLVAGLIALSITRIDPLWLRIITGVAVSALPLAWFTFGYALEFGFYNATLALLIMLTTWLMWQRGMKYPYLRIAGLALALVCSLAAWGPLALIPAILALVGVWEIVTKRKKPESHFSFWLALFSIVFGACYGFFVTLPDLRQQSGSLGADGGIFEISPTTAAITVAICFVLLIFTGFALKDKNELLGITFFTGASLLAVAYLALQRGPDVSRWGYYPVKYTWFLMCTLIILATAYSLAWISSKKYSPMKTVLATCSVALVMFGVAWQMPIRVAPTSLSIFPIANMLTHTGIAGEDSYASRLFSVAVDDKPTIAYKGNDAFSDQFANRWLLQLESKTSEDKVRYWAYFMDSNNSEQLCQALLDWDTSVTIITAETGLENQLRADCPSAVFSIQKDK